MYQQQYTQQPYYFQNPPPNARYEYYFQPIHIKQPDLVNEKWAWAPRSEKMKWDLAESIEVEEIVRRGDLSALKFYIESFVNANITEEDSKKFGSKGALNVFLLMQLGVDYLLKQCHNFSINAIMSQFTNPPQVDNSQTLLAQSQQIAEMKSEIESRDVEIIKYRQQNAKLYDDISKLKKKNSKLKSQLRNEQFLLETTRKKKKVHRHNHEPGMIKTLNGFEDFEKLNRTIPNNSPNPVFSSGNINLITQTIPSDQLSEGEIDINGLTHNIGSIKRSSKNNNSSFNFNKT